SGSSGSQTYHRVQKGESLWLIARKYRVTVNQLKQWNGLSGNTISYGKKLVVYPGSTGTTAAAPQRTERAAAKTPQSAVSGSNVLVQQNISRGESFNYAVTAGNNLGEIAGVFGVSVSQLKSWNNLRSNTIRVGQRLRIVAQTGIRYYQYRVQSGDTISEIASRFNARDSIIRFANAKSNNLLTVGEVLKIFSF
ncbi:MAG: LysM peptidoglycan-binding domain-containing protein, partial [Calditrichaeota bacterium]|nr:LysM peptidoglycan-binding domain-containing protein [Calditrichota bacterium]